MSKDLYTVAEAARLLGVSIDTVRRWDREGRIATERDGANRRTVPAAEIDRLRGAAETKVSARNRFHGTIESIEVEGLLAQVEIVVTQPARIVALITRDAVVELGLKPGMAASGVVKATSVMVERE
jgi:molybdopterin-binding protein